MDETPLRAALQRLGDSQQPPSTVNLDVVRRRGRRMLAWRRARLAGTSTLAVGLVAGLLAGSVFPGTGGSAGPSAAPPALPQGCARGGDRLILKPGTAMPGQSVSVIGAGIGTRPDVIQGAYDQLGTATGGGFTPLWNVALLARGYQHWPNEAASAGVPAVGYRNGLFHFKVPSLAPGYYVIESDFSVSGKDRILCAPLHVVSRANPHRTRQSAKTNCPPRAICPSPLPPKVTFLPTINGKTGVLRKDGHVPSYRIRPGEHLTVSVVVTVPKHLTLAALWLGISAGTWGNGPHGRPTGMNPILVHRSQPLTPGQHAFKFRWRTPQRRSPSSLYLTFAWSSPDASVSGPVAQLLPS